LSGYWSSVEEGKRYLARGLLAQYPLERSDNSWARRTGHRVEGSCRPLRKLPHSGVERRLDQGGSKAELGRNSAGKSAWEFQIASCAGDDGKGTTSWKIVVLEELGTMSIDREGGRFGKSRRVESA